MKTNYILLILLLSFSFARAQSNVPSVETQINNTVSVSEVNDAIATDANNTNEDVNEAVLIDTDDVKESVARSNSDIRLYLNRLRNVDNINLLFPQMNKAKSV